MVAILTPSQVKDVGDGKQIHIADFGMYRVAPEVAANHLEAMGEYLERDVREIAADITDAKDGYWETRKANQFKKFAFGFVIGENLDAKIPEYGTADAHLPEFHRRVVRWMRPAEMPRLGDVVVCNQRRGVDYTTFLKEPCDTNAACEFLITNSDETRWVRVPRNADVTTIPISDVIGFPVERAVEKSVA